MDRYLEEGTDMSVTGEGEVWRVVCYQARREHERQMNLLASGRWPGTTPETNTVKVMMFRGEECDWLSVGKASWVSAVEYYSDKARMVGGQAIGAIMVGVMPEQEQGKVHLRPALLTVVTGVGMCEGRRFDIGHRFTEEPEAVVFYGPVSMDGEGLTKARDWNVECGMEGILIGPWPKRLPRSVSSGGEVITK